MQGALVAVLGFGNSATSVFLERIALDQVNLIKGDTL